MSAMARAKQDELRCTETSNMGVGAGVMYLGAGADTSIQRNFLSPNFDYLLHSATVNLVHINLSVQFCIILLFCNFDTIFSIIVRIPQLSHRTAGTLYCWHIVLLAHRTAGTSYC